jgi:uncharacterized membrane protein YdjX (TVP38/TMEM64 family)
VKRWARPAILVVLVAAAVWANRSFDLSWAGVVEGTRGIVEPLGPWGPVAFVGICIAAALIHAPELVVIALGGVLFGKLGGFFYGWIGGVSGGAVCFLLARYLFRDLVQRSLVKRFGSLQRLDAHLERHGFRTIVALRLVLFLAPPMNWAIGTTKVRFVHYVGGSIVGVIPGLALTVVFADEITKVSSPGELVRPEVLIPAALIAGFLVMSFVVARRVLSDGERADR